MTSWQKKLIVKQTVLFFIKLYQIILSPILGPACRFYPSCSEYAYQAVSRHGVFKGAFLSCKRFLRCHPFNPGGFDPVP
ncbi:MAG: membrane protein insertion efficiency factor YidD [Deltaproteobacteria bacterium]|nr:membrane protein insertion efficiency factor YidD [Deltaproteobacteria bacterium]